MGLTFEPVLDEDFEPMAELRIAALRESLERLGRFDPQRARDRLKSAFIPKHMRHICKAGERVGYLTLLPVGPDLRLEHFYVRPGQQGKGIGAWVMAWVKSHDQDVTLSALKFSDANRFYLRHGFKVVGESEFDIDYLWTAAA